MTKVLVTESSLEAIADAIRAKNGSGSTYKPGQMAAAIAAIPEPSTLVTKSITANGSYNPASDNADGYSSVTVNVSGGISAEDEGKVVSNGVLVAQTARSGAITTNGTYDTTTNNSVTVNVSAGASGVMFGNAYPSANVGADGDIYIVTIPDGAVAKSYLQSTGPQYIMSGVIASESIDVEMTANFQKVSGSNADAFGVRTAYGVNEFRVVVVAGSNDISFRKRAANVSGSEYGAVGLPSSSWSNGIHELKTVTNSGSTAFSLYFDGVDKTATQAIINGSFSASLNIPLFAFNDNGNISTTGGFIINKIKFLDSGVPVRDYIPVIDPNGEAGMYDFVNGTYARNAGSGNFAYGETVDPVWRAFVKISGAWVQVEVLSELIEALIENQD